MLYQVKFESGQTSTIQPLNFFRFVVSEAILYKVECIWTGHSTFVCIETRSKHFYTVFKMASHVEHGIEEIQPNKQSTGRGKGKKWSDSKTDKLIDLLEKHFCLWDISKKEYHLRNLRERAYEEMRDELDIEIADIKTKIMNLRSQLGREVVIIIL